MEIDSIEAPGGSLGWDALERLDGIGRPELRAALLYVRGASAPVTADEAGVALDIHRAVARDRLELLLRAGLLEASFARRSGRSGPGAGRPAKLYSAAPEPEALEFPPRRLPTLVAHLLDAVPAEGREDALRRAGEDYGRDLARAAGLRRGLRRASGLERVCAAVRALGFQATLDCVDGDTAVISTPTCPLRPVVAARPEAAHIDRGMWAGLVERGLRGVRAASVECETSSCLDHGEQCTVVIRLRRPS
jgi:predicted ArsR family transcriptional regulator